MGYPRRSDRCSQYPDPSFNTGPLCSTPTPKPQPGTWSLLPPANTQPQVQTPALSWAQMKRGPEPCGFKVPRLLLS